MGSFIRNIVVRLTNFRLKNRTEALTGVLLEKELKVTRVELSHFFKDSAMILLGVICASFGLKGFLLPNQFIDGGVTGISLILTEITGYSLSAFLVIVNAPFIILGFSTIGRQFAVRSLFAIAILAISVHFIEAPTVTDDKLLIAVFGGFFLGAGIGLAIRGGAVIDGTEV
ncbi:MAG: YitT family protein, partial [Altibacter sp.]|nr:YitT family protein [Altibacter sp.]